MKALSLRQPWIWAIINLGKDVENRTWSTRIRGRVLLHASKKYDHEGAWWIADTFGVVLPGPNSLPRGGIVGSVEITDYVKKMESKWFSGPYGFVLNDPIEIEYQACNGRLGFFELAAKATL